MSSNRTELIRKGWHMMAGLLALPLVLYTNLPYATLAALAAAFFVMAVEVLHLYFGIRVPFWSAQLERVRRPEEHFSWASIGFLLTLVALFWVTPMVVAVAAAGMLAFGDTLSSLGGRAFGRVRLPWNPRKTLEGSLSGFVGGLLGAFLLVAWYQGATGTQLAPLHALLLVGVGSAAAMVAESLPRLEDNVSIPAFSGAAMFVVWTALRLDPAAGPIAELASAWSP